MNAKAADGGQIPTEGARPGSASRNMSADVARRVFLGAQGFADAAPKGAVTARHMRRVMGRLGVIQLDSIPVVIRTQYLPFHARLGPYETDLFDRVAYGETERRGGAARPYQAHRPGETERRGGAGRPYQANRPGETERRGGAGRPYQANRPGETERSGKYWFEAWSHEASLLPVELEPQFRWMRERARDGATWKGLYEVAQREPQYVQAVLEEVRERGEVTGGTLSDPRPVERDGSGWWHRSLGVLALDWLFRIGEVGIRRQGNFEKVFSPLDAFVPSDILATPTPTEDEAISELIARSVRSLGVGTAEDVADYYRLPIRDVRRLLPEVVESGRIGAAKVKGWDKPAFVDPDAKTPRTVTGATVLSPFDPIVWKRDRAERIWNFEYRIEIYVPEKKRRWGYYVLPVMVDGHLVARLDVKTDRANSVLRIKAAHLEEGHDGAEVAQRVLPAIDDLRRLVNVDDIHIERKGNFAIQLRS